MNTTETRIYYVLTFRNLIGILISKCQIKKNLAYSASVAIDDGHLTSASKRKIVTLLMALIVQHTLYPTSEQYVAVCTKLVQKYPKLRDPIGSGIVSIASQLVTGK